MLTGIFPQQYGLYSAFMGCFVYFFLGTSRDVTLGPTAIMSLLVSFYTFREPAYAVLLAFLSGCIQLAMGLLHLGKTLPSCCGEWLQAASLGVPGPPRVLFCASLYTGVGQPPSGLYSAQGPEVLEPQSLGLPYLPKMPKMWGWKDGVSVRVFSL